MSALAPSNLLRMFRNIVSIVIWQIVIALLFIKNEFNKVMWTVVTQNINHAVALYAVFVFLHFWNNKYMK